MNSFASLKESYWLSNNLQTYYLLKKKAKVVSGDVKTATFTFTSPKQYDKIVLDETNVIDTTVSDTMVSDTNEMVNEPEVNFKAYPVPFTDILTVQYKYEYDTDVKIQVFDTKGLLISSITDTEYIKGEIGSKNLDLSRVADQALIIRLITNKEVMSKMVISKSIEK